MAGRWFPGDRYAVRPGSAWWSTGILGALAAAVAAGALTPPTRHTPAILLTVVTVLVAGWEWFWRPQLVVTESAVTVVNPWRTHEVPWAALVDVETRFHLTLVTAQGRYAAHAAPSPGGLAALRTRERGDPEATRAARAAGGRLRPGDLPDTPSGAAARVVRGHWQDLVEAGGLPRHGPAARVVTSTHRAVLLLTGVLAALTVVAWVGTALTG